MKQEFIEHNGGLYQRVKSLRHGVDEAIVRDAVFVSDRFCEWLNQGMTQSDALVWDIVMVNGLLGKGEFERAKAHLAVTRTRCRQRRYESLHRHGDGFVPDILPEVVTDQGNADLNAYGGSKLTTQLLSQLIEISELLEFGHHEQATRKGASAIYLIRYHLGIEDLPLVGVKGGA